MKHLALESDHMKSYTDNDPWEIYIFSFKTEVFNVLLEIVCIRPRVVKSTEKVYDITM